jgi:hypothetical protein
MYRKIILALTSATTATSFIMAAVALLGTGLPAAAAVPGISYNIARVTAHNFVETWSSMRGGVLHIRAVVSNGENIIFGHGPFGPIVTLAFSSHGKKTGELKLLFNLPASVRDQTYEIDVPNGALLWEMSDHIETSAANNPNAGPTPGSWQITGGVGGGFPVVIQPN